MQLKIDYDSKIPLHAQVEKLLRKLIREPEYSNGKLLPTEEAIAEHLGISRSTLRAGTDKLVYEGILERKPGVGTRVVPQNMRVTNLNAWISFTREMEAQGLEVQTFFYDYRQESVSCQTAEIFGVKEKSKIFCLERVKGYNAKPVVHFISYFHPRLKLTGKEDFSCPMYETIEAECNAVAMKSREKITAVLPSRKMTKALQIDSRIPLLRRERVVSNPGGRVIEHAINHYRSDCFVYTTEIQRKI